MLGRGEFVCGMVLVYQLSEKINSSLFEFLPKCLKMREERERERERERWFCHDKCHHHLSPLIMSCIKEFWRMRNTFHVIKNCRISIIYMMTNKKVKKMLKKEFFMFVEEVLSS